MAKSTKKKPMTQREKKLRAEARSELRKKGILPEPKKPLNRKAFIKDAKEDYTNTINTVYDEFYVFKALYEMVGTGIRPTLENIGAAKVMKMACELKRFHEELKETGRTHYTVGEYVERLEPIYKA